MTVYTLNRKSAGTQMLSMQNASCIVLADVDKAFQIYKLNICVVSSVFNIYVAQASD